MPSIHYTSFEVLKQDKPTTLHLPNSHHVLLIRHRETCSAIFHATVSVPYVVVFHVHHVVTNFEDVSGRKPVKKFYPVVKVYYERSLIEIGKTKPIEQIGFIHDVVRIGAYMRSVTVRLNHTWFLTRLLHTVPQQFIHDFEIHLPINE